MDFGLVYWSIALGWFGYETYRAVEARHWLFNEFRTTPMPSGHLKLLMGVAGFLAVTVSAVLWPLSAAHEMVTAALDWWKHRPCKCEEPCSCGCTDEICVEECVRGSCSCKR